MTTPAIGYDSLIISNKIELIGSGAQGTPSADPRCTGAVFILDRGFDLGEPQPVSSIVGSLAVDGERPIGRRASNRTLTLPITIMGPDRATIVSAREVLFNEVDRQSFTITWVRAGGSAAIIDCFRAQPSKIEYDYIAEQELVAYVTLTIPALPYLRSADPQPLAFAGNQAGRSASPPLNITLDDYSVVSGTYWSAAQAGTPTGTAAHWSNPTVVSMPAVAPTRLCSLAFTGTTANTNGAFFTTISGDGIILTIQTLTAATTISVSDGGINTYTQIATTPISGGGALYVFASFNSAPVPIGRAFTVTTSPSNTLLVEVDYWRGVTALAGSPVVASGTSTSPATGPVTTTATPCIQMTAIANNNSADLSVMPSAVWNLASLNFAGTERSRVFYSGGDTGNSVVASYAAPQSWAVITLAFQFTLAPAFLQAVNASYTKAFTAKNIKGMTSLTHWIGTASTPVPVPVSSPFVPVTPYPLPRDLGDLHVHYTLTDSVGRGLQLGSAWHKEPGAKLTAPTWTLVTTRLPQTGLNGFDYGHVVGVKATITNYAYSTTRVVDVFLDDLKAAPSSVPRTTAGARGRADTITGVLGTARAPISLVAAQTYTPVGVGPVYPATYSDGFLTLPCNSSFNAVAQSGSVLNMNGSSVYAGIAQVPTGNGTTQAKFQARYDSANYAGFLSGGDKKISCQLNQAGSITTQATNFFATQSTYWRIREGAPTTPTGGLVQVGWVNFAGVAGNIGPYLPGQPTGQSQGPFVAGTTDGDAILVLVLTTGSGTVTVTDTNLNTYNLVGSGLTGDGQTQYWFVAPSGIAINTLNDNINIHCTVSQNFSVSAFTAAGYFDADVHNSNFSPTQTTPLTVSTGAMGVSGEIEIAGLMSGFHPYQDVSSTPSGWTRTTRVYCLAYSITDTVFWKKATSQLSDTVTTTWPAPCFWSAFVLTLKPRINAGIIYWDVSNDGVSWTNIYSHVHSFGTKLQFMRAYFNAGYSGSEANPPPFLVTGVGTT